MVWWDFLILPHLTLLLPSCSQLMEASSPPRVPSGARNLSPRNLSEDFLGMGSATRVISAPSMYMMCAEVHPEMGKEIECMDVMKEPPLKLLWERLGKKCVELFQGLQDIKVANTCFSIELKNIPKDRKITYGNSVCDYKPHKKEKECVHLIFGG
jgi:hypothetical protein